jgi:hypothetical protein
MEIDFFVRSARSHRRSECKEMIDREHEVPTTRQCQLLDLSRSSFYYQPLPVSDKDRGLMRLLQRLLIVEWLSC